MKKSMLLASLLPMAAVTFNAAPAMAAPAKSPNVHAGLSCDEGIKTRFRPDDQTTVLLVKAFRKGEPLILSGEPKADTAVAANDVCLVKINVGPGNPGPADAPSTSAGIGIEIWLPSPARWNERIHVQGGGGWAGGDQASTSIIDDRGVGGHSAAIAGIEGAVAATTDTGHSVRRESTGNLAGGTGSFAMLPDGGVNTALWRDFSDRSLHEMAVKSKALAAAYYGRPARYAYWDGFSTGGRQGLKEAQVHPGDFDGILVGAPAINWTRFITAELNPQIVMQREIGRQLAPAQLSLVSNAAIRACDVVGGEHLGYVPNPASCRYDPVRDPEVLCRDAGGHGPVDGCVSLREAAAIDKIWYGLTTDGQSPDPAIDNGFGVFPARNQRWFGLTRGTDLSRLAGAKLFTVSSDLVALELGDSRIATPSFANARGNGQDGWKALGYADLNRAFDMGVTAQQQYADINTDRPDLYAFRDEGGKMIMYHGLADVLIPPQGSINYYTRVQHEMGGLDEVRKFYRFYLVPGMSHAFANGSANPAAVVPLPDHDELYAMLTRWVEQGRAPERYDIAAKENPERTAALCLFPQQPEFTGGDPKTAAAYTCK